MADVERAEDLGTEAKGIVTRWIKELDLAESHEKDWRERAKKVVERYRDDDRKSESDADTRYNVLYANTEVLKGVMYQKTPVPDVRRRFLDKDPIARQAAQIVQRALSYSVDSYDFDDLMVSIVEDVLLPGRGTACVKYLPTMSKDGQQVVYQEARCEYVEWEMFRMSPAKRWSKVRWVAIGELMTRADLDRFGDAGKACTLDWAPKDKPEDEMFKRALVWAVWDKKSLKVFFICKGSPDRPLLTVDDPLGLEGFFPCPKPVYSVCTTNSLIPVPEYIQYQDQAMELDTVTERITVLCDALRRRGVYDGNFKEIEQLAKAGDNQFIPIENYAALVEKGGLEKALMQEPIEAIAKVLLGLYQQREQILAIIYQITGLSDIVRGASKASETATAQEIKGRYANVRVGPRQRAVQKFARDLMRMKAEIMCEKFTPEVLKLMTGADMWMVEQEVIDPRTQQKVKQRVDATPQIMELLRNEKLRGFRVDIETDSTVMPDAAEEQKNRVELLAAVAQYVTGMGPAVQSGAVPMDLAKELLGWGVRGFKVGPQIEEALDRLGGQQPQNPADARLMAENQQLKAMADENKVKRDEMALRREEMEAQREERRARVAEAQAKRDQEAIRADEDARVRAEERDMKREELGARRYELDRKAEEASRNRDAEVAKVAQTIKGEVGATDEGLKALADAIKESSQAQLQMVDKLAQALVQAVSADKELYVDPKSGRKRVRVVRETVQ